MKVEIWSDVMCPFCYIGKRHFEKALAAFPFAAEIEVEWKSFQLNPDYYNTDNEDLYTYLARSKGMSVLQAQQLTGKVVEMAANVDIALDFQKNVPANSFNAHRLIHLAKSHGKQDEAEEALFYAHFIAGKNIADQEVLLAIANDLSLDVTKAEQVLNGDDFSEAVKHDIDESKQLGISGVPYFVFDRKYALSGAQPIPVFEQALVQSFTEWQSAKSL